MSELATNLGVTPFTAINNTNAVIPRGTRITRQSNGNFSPTADQTTRGDAVALVDIPASGNGAAALSQNGKISALFDGSIAVGAIAYAGASNGVFSPTSTNAVVMGRCTLAGSSTAMGEVELMTNV